MTAGSIVLVGLPDSGKTNYIGRLWTALQYRKGRLTAPQVPNDIRYVEDTVAHLMHGRFAPRSEKIVGASRRDFAVPVVTNFKNRVPVSFELLVPDVSGELWSSAVETFELPLEWMEQINHSVGALLFVRVLSEQDVRPLDWVNAEQLLRLLEPDDRSDSKLPTQVALCELLRFLEHALRRDDSGTRRPRVAVVVTAWDLLDEDRRSEGPTAYLRKEYPMFAGRLDDIATLDVRVFGISVVGGSLDDPLFKETFLRDGELQEAGYVAVEDGEVRFESDLTYPVAWVVE